MASHACWRTARSGRAVCAPPPTVGARRGASGRSCQSILAIADGDRAARGLDRLFGGRNICDPLDARLFLLVDVAVLGAVVDRPLGARGIEAGIDRPDTIFGEQSIAYSTASLGLSVAFSMIGTTCR